MSLSDKLFVAVFVLMFESFVLMFLPKCALNGVIFVVVFCMSFDLLYYIGYLICECYF